MFIGRNTHRSANQRTLASRRCRQVVQCDRIGQQGGNSIGIVLIPDAGSKDGIGFLHIIGCINELDRQCFCHTATDHSSCVAVVGDIGIALDGAVILVVANHIGIAVILGKLTIEDVIPDGSALFLIGNTAGCLCINDLAKPFCHIRDGKGIGSLFVIRAVDEPSTTDPGEGNLTEFKVFLGDELTTASGGNLVSSEVN